MMAPWPTRVSSGIALVAGLAGTLTLAGCVGTAGPTSQQVTGTVQPQAPSRPELVSMEPILRIETTMHTGRIKAIAIDEENRFLATGSQDRTIRVWDLAIGRLVSVLRPPIGENRQGEIYAIAISPNGKTIAVGGAANFSGSNSQPVYLFDRTSGKIIQTITGHKNTITRLSYSRDGRFLLVSLNSPYAIHIYRTTDYSLIAEDKTDAPNSRGRGVDFDVSGRLVTSSEDGLIRLYDANFKLIGKTATKGGKHSYSVRFSHDGSKIAVGFADTGKIDVVSGTDLSYLYSPDTSGIGNGIFPVVEWSFRGDMLYAGGNDRSRDLFFVRKWKEAGRGSYKDIPLAVLDVIMDVRTLKSGGFVFGSADPAIGLFDQDDQRQMLLGPELAFREAKSEILVTDDGLTVQFEFEYGGKIDAQFASAERTLKAGAFADARLNHPLTTAEGITVSGVARRVKHGETRPEVQLNGRTILQSRNESAHSLAIAPNKDVFLLGTVWGLRVFDKNGTQRWGISTFLPAWGVNISGNGRVAIASLEDGTIRWYRMTDGKELLAFFPHADRKRWVLWTPSGYYDASPGAEELIGWHVNRGKDQAADFFPVGQFRDRFYRPDIVAKVLETLDEGTAVRLANEAGGRKAQTASLAQQLPPVVTILSPSEGTVVSTQEIAIRVAIRSSSPVTGLKALVDGRPVATERGVQVGAGLAGGDGTPRELRVTLPARDAEVAVIAENPYAASVPAVVRLKWKGAVQTDEFVIKPKLYVLAVGVSQYQQADLKLGLAAKDAQDFAAVLTRQQGGLYREVAAKVLTDAQATRDEVMDGLDWLQKQTTSKDVAMLFLAGHGVNDPAGIYYYLPVNADPDKLKRTGIAFSDVKNTLAALAGKALFFVDTCHSGNVMGTRRGAADINAVVNELASAENGTVVFASSTGRQYALEDPAWGNGAFTKALVEGLSGKADYGGKGKISINMLDLYLSERVKELTKGQQTPTTTKPNTVPDFPVAVRQ